MKTLEIHKIALAYPELPEDEKQNLLKSIETHGLLDPITLYQGKILDGRHRYECCKSLGIPIKSLKTVQYKGKDPMGFADAKNLHRRHLTAGQRAMLAARQAKILTEIAQETGKGDDSITNNREHCAENHNVSLRSVYTAEELIKTAPASVVDQVESGEISLNAGEAKAAVKSNKSKPAQVLDETGWPVPESLHDIWSRKNEVMALLKEIAHIETRILKYQESKDPVFCAINYSDVVCRLQNLHTSLKEAQLYAVCTSCSGRSPKTCALCKTRGIISKFIWDILVPSEVKEMRKRSSKASR